MLTTEIAKAEPEFITAKDLSFRGILHDIKKSNTSLSPIFEAFTNALEAIKIKRETNSEFGKGKIKITIYSNELTDKTFDFRQIEILDNGIGFNEIEFKRFNTFKDNSKGYKNLGSGRIQYVHFFDKTIIKSVFQEGNSFYEREFVVSKNKQFLDKNAIVKLRYLNPTIEQDTHTLVTFSGLLEPSTVYNSLNDETLKAELLKRYLHYFCFNSDNIPEIELEHFVYNTLASTSKITKKDIPNFDKREPINISYSKPSVDAQTIEYSDKSEEFLVTTFKVTKNLLETNDIKLISKGEVVDDTKINLTGISKNDNINGNKYLVLVSGNYIDEKDTNVRGELEIPSRTSTKAFNVFNSEVIFLEDIEVGVNNELIKLYPEIEKIIEKHETELEHIKEMFLIGDEDDVDISLNDDDKKILEKFYEAQAKKEARLDATLKQSIDKLESLDTTSKNYEEELEREINKIVRILPEQKQTNLKSLRSKKKTCH